MQYVNEIPETSGTLIVCFTAPTCQPCEVQKAILEDFEQAHGISAVLVDSTEHPEIAHRYAVRSHPTLVVLQGGDLQHIGVGVHSARALNSLTR